MPKALLAGIGLDERDLLLGAAGEAQVGDRLRIDREDRAGRAELRRHVPDRRAVGNRQRRDARTVELDELADDAVGAQQLGDRQHEVGRGGALRQLAVKAHADHLRDQHRHRLAEHRGLGLDSPDAPAEHAEAVDHRGVRIGPDERVGIGPPGLRVMEDHAREVLQVDLVDDAGVRRHDGEAVEGLLAPAQELVALTVAVELERRVDRERLARAEGVDLDRVVDHQLRRRERVDLVRAAAHLRHRVAHRGEVDDRRHSRQVLHQHARRGERDLAARLGRRVPAGQGAHVVRVDRSAALVAQEVLEQDLQRERQRDDRELLAQRAEPEDLVLAAVDLERALRSEAVLRHETSFVGAAERGAAHSRRAQTALERRGLLARDASLASALGAEQRFVACREQRVGVHP